MFQPARTWVFVVGLLKWQHSEMWPSFPAAELNRRDQQFVDYFRGIGVPEQQITYLKDERATKPRIERAFRKLLDQTHEHDLLVFYFCGHGWRDTRSGRSWFANYEAGSRDDSSWSVTAIFDTVEQYFRGDRAWLLADCCHSGALFDEAYARRDSRIAYAALTSAYSHNSSTGRWTFSDAVLSGLKGRAVVDTNRDGVIAWQELANYTELEMAFIEGQKSMFAAHPSFPADARVATTVGSRQPHVGERVEGWWEGKWYKARIIDSRQEQRKVHWIGYDASQDEWLTTDRIRAYRPLTYAPTSLVDVRWSRDGVWYPATVLKSWYGLHLIHYDGFTTTWDEWVAADKIRARTNASRN